MYDDIVAGLYNPNSLYGYATTRSKTPVKGDDGGQDFYGNGPSGVIQLPNGQLIDSSIFENDARLLDAQGNTYQSIGTGIDQNLTYGLQSLQRAPNGQYYLNENDFATYGTRLPKEDGWLSKLGAGILALPLAGFGAAGGFAALGAGAGAGAEGAVGAGGAAGGLPESYWSMLADGGGIASDAAPAAAGTFGAGGAGTGAFDTFGSLGTPLAGGGAGYIPAEALAYQGVTGGAALPGFAAAAGIPLSSLLAMNGLNIGGNLASALIGSSAARNAANIQSSAADRAAGIADSQFQQTRADLAPWRQAGGVALNRITDLLGLSVPGVENSADHGSLMRNFGASDLASDPIYGAAKDFQLSEGQRQLTNAASARGETDSGVLMRDLLKYGTGVLSGLGTDSYNRFQNNRTTQYNMLAPTANLGQQTGVQLGSLGANMAGQVGSNITSGANAQAAGAVGSSNAFSQAISSALSNFQNQQLINRFLGSNQQQQNQFGAFSRVMAE